MNGEELLANFQTHLRADKLSEATIYTYGQCVTEFLSVIGRHPERTTKRHIESFKAHLSERVGPRSIVVALAAIGNFLEQYDNYACSKVKRPRIPWKQPIVLTEEEINRLLKAASKDPLANAVISVLYYTGMRSGSLQRLGWSDVLWDEDRVILRNVKRGKTITILLPPQAKEALLAYSQYREEPIDTEDDDVVFILPTTGQPLAQPAVNYLVKKYAAKAGIRKRVYAHLLRHTHGTIARKKGLSLDAIARQLGHEDISTTQLYAQLADDVYEREYQDFFAAESHVKPLNVITRKRQPEFDSAYR